MFIKLILIHFTNSFNTESIFELSSFAHSVKQELFSLALLHFLSVSLKYFTIDCYC